MGLTSSVTLFPASPEHRLVGDDLAAFLDRLSERVVALGNGARARVRAGRFDAEAYTLTDLLDTLNAARRSSKGREDLELRLYGPARDRLAKFLGTQHLELKFCAFVEPHLLLDCSLCASCRRPLDWDAASQGLTCNRPSCGDGERDEGPLHTCWWLRFFGDGSDGIGERFVEEGRRFEGSTFFEALEGISRVPLLEWHAWS